MSNDSYTNDKKMGYLPALLLLTGAAVIFTMATLVSLRISSTTEMRGYASEALRSTQKINENVTLAIGTLHSMVAAHQASPTGFGQTQFQMFAENLVSSQASITATGRFESIPHSDLDHLTSDLQLHGLFQFEPKTINVEGKITTLGEKTQYAPMIAFYPQDPVSANFIGLDLSELDSTQTAITNSLLYNQPVPAELPASWITNGQLNIFTSTYYGHYIPETVEDRNIQSDGGYFITLNLNEVIAQATGDDFPLNVDISIHSINESDTIANQKTLLNQSRSSAKLFPSTPIHHNVRFGADSASIIYSTPAGVTKTQLNSALIKGLASLAIYLIGLMIFALVVSLRARVLKKEKALAKERARALITLNSLQDAVITSDREDNIDYVNPAILNLLKVDRNALLGLPLEQFLESSFIDEKLETTSITNNTNKQGISSANTVKRLVSDSLDAVILDCHSSDIEDHENNKIGAVLTLRDISNEHALTSELAHQATHDALTLLPNRRKFETLLDKLLNKNNPANSGRYVVGYIDLDQFKLVNDTVGHAAGDELLKKLAIDLQTFAPDNFEIARLGGDEFGIISTEKNTCNIVEIAESFHDFFQSYFYQTKNNIFSIRASIGLTSVKAHHNTINDVLSEVDIACYTAKDNGRNGYVIYNPDDDETKEREDQMLYLPMLQSALKDNRLTLFTQPIVSTNALDSEPVHHYECLLRLINEEGKIVTPYNFIVAAERYNLIQDIDLWVIENAFSNISKLKGSSLEDTIFSINLSGQSAVDATMPGFIDSKLKEYDIKSSNICFELTETAVISNFSQAQKLIAFVRDRGCTIALDDFGAGASSFGYLKNLEVDYLKIDGQFVKEMTSNKVDFEMVRSMNSVGKALGIKTIAEFVENKEVMQALASINVDYAQGYFAGKPMPMAHLLGDSRLKTAA